MNKLVFSAQEAVSRIPNGASILSTGFGLCGNAENLIAAINESGIKGLTVISNNCGTTEHGLSILLRDRQIKKMISSYVGENAVFEAQYLGGEIEVELIPQGTLAEKIRCGGAGIPAFYTPTGAGTQVEFGGLPIQYDHDGNVIQASKPKESKVFNGKKYIMEESITADFAIIRAHTADTYGNLVYNKTARNFAPMMCTAAKYTIVEAENIVQPGEIDPDQVHTPGVYVHAIIQGKNYPRLIENRTVQPKI